MLDLSFIKKALKELFTETAPMTTFSGSVITPTAPAPQVPFTGRIQPADIYGGTASDQQLPAPITRKVVTITHNPILPTLGGQTVREYFNWNHADELARQYAEDVRQASYGYANYQIVDQIEVDAYPIKKDGFRYDEYSYLKAWKDRNFHDPDAVDYLALVRDFNMIERIDSGEVDEIWLFGHPYGGYYESIMAGPGAVWCNAPALEGTEHASRKFVIMGFNFERGVGEMLENLGHRAESILNHVYRHVPENRNLWKQFIRYDKTHPGQAELGNVHFAPNSDKDYDWGNPRPVPSYCDTWLNFPDLSNTEPRTVTCHDWGDGDIRLHHLWWFRHMPHIVGSSDGVSYNWWEYFIDPNTF